VATHGENTGYEVPCLIVAAKDDLDQSPQALQESTRVSVLAFNPIGIVDQSNPDYILGLFPYLFMVFHALGIM
jgi:hypothetical protein